MIFFAMQIACSFGVNFALQRALHQKCIKNASKCIKNGLQNMLSRIYFDDVELDVHFMYFIFELQRIQSPRFEKLVNYWETTLNSRSSLSVLDSILRIQVVKLFWFLSSYHVYVSWEFAFYILDNADLMLGHYLAHNSRLFSQVFKKNHPKLS